MSSEAGEMPNLDEAVDARSVRTTLPMILALIRPKWNAQSVEIEDKSDGYCNTNVVCRTAEYPDDDFLIRIVNEHIPGLLERNIVTMKLMQKFELCPPLLCTFKNGLCMGFVKGTPVKWANSFIIREEPHWSNIGREMARYHTLVPTAEALAAGMAESTGGLDERLLKRVGAMLDDGSIPKEALDRLPSIADLREGGNRLMARLKSLGADWAFLHQDINPSNIILTDDPDEGKGAFFVDYDCCGVGPAILDIGWTFSSSLDIKNPDLSLYPDDTAQKTFIRAYLERKSVLRGEAVKVSERDVSYLQFLLRTARLCAYLRIIGATLIMQTISSRLKKENKEAGLQGWEDQNWLAFKMWKFYKDNVETVLSEKFTE